jgi:hypothetical protein
MLYVKLGAFAAAKSAIGWLWKILALTWLVSRWPGDFLRDRIAPRRPQAHSNVLLSAS